MEKNKIKKSINNKSLSYIYLTSTIYSANSLPSSTIDRLALAEEYIISTQLEKKEQNENI